MLRARRECMQLVLADYPILALKRLERLGLVAHGAEAQRHLERERRHDQEDRQDDDATISSRVEEPGQALLLVVATGAQRRRGSRGRGAGYLLVLREREREGVRGRERER